MSFLCASSEVLASPQGTASSQTGHGLFARSVSDEQQAEKAPLLDESGRSFLTALVLGSRN
jgi:hypothetical protein